MVFLESDSFCIKKGGFKFMNHTTFEMLKENLILVLWQNVEFLGMLKCNNFRKLLVFFCLLQQFPGIRVISLLGKAIASVAASLRNYIYRLAAFTIKITLASQQQQL